MFRTWTESLYYAHFQPIHHKSLFFEALLRHIGLAYTYARLCNLHVFSSPSVPQVLCKRKPSSKRSYRSGAVHWHTWVCNSVWITSMCVLRNMVVHSRNQCCGGKAIFYVCVCVCVCVCVALVTQKPKHMRRITLSSAACLALPYFSTLSHKRHDFGGEKNRTWNVFWFCLQLLSETLLFLRRTKGDISYMYRVSYTTPVVLVRFQSNLTFLDIFSENTQMSNLMNISPVGVELFHADGQTRRS